MSTSLFDLLGQHAPDNLAPADRWQKHAECRFEDPDLFHPIGTTGPAITQTEEAKAVCRRCPVRETCLQWAFDHHEHTGVWGGLSEAERRRLKRQARSNRTAQ
ncbi:WhiB family redox-sensing transcriptional regulator [Streptomyces griseus]